MISVSYHNTVNVLQGAIDTRGAQENASPPSPFGRAEWFSLLAEGGMVPLIAMAERGAEQAILPLTQGARGLEPLVNWYSFIWRPIGNFKGHDDQMLAALARDLRKKSHRVTFWPLPDEDGTATRLEMAFRKAGWSVARKQCDHNHVLPVNGRSFAEYWSTRPGKMRTTLARKAKKVDIEILTHFDPLAWAAYENIYAQSWKPAEGNPALLRQFAEAEGAAGRIRLGIARHEGVPVAAQFWTLEGGTAHIHKLAHLEEHKALSAGTTLSAALFEHVIDQDRAMLVDFGTGNDRYKMDWMEQDRPRYRLDCLDLRQFAAWPVLARRGAVRLAHTIRRS